MRNMQEDSAPAMRPLAFKAPKVKRANEYELWVNREFKGGYPNAEEAELAVHELQLDGLKIESVDIRNKNEEDAA